MIILNSGGVNMIFGKGVFLLGLFFFAEIFFKGGEGDGGWDCVIAGGLSY